MASQTSLEYTWPPANHKEVVRPEASHQRIRVGSNERSYIIEAGLLADRFETSQFQGRLFCSFSPQRYTTVNLINPEGSSLWSEAIDTFKSSLVVTCAAQRKLSISEFRWRLREFFSPKILAPDMRSLGRSPLPARRPAI